MIVRQPIVAANVSDRYDIVVNVRGGGIAGQAGAIRHGIARASSMPTVSSIRRL